MNDMAAVAIDPETLLENPEEEDDEEERADRGESQRRDGEGTGEEFTLDLVRQLGGTKADYIMLYSLNDNEELIDGGKKNAIDDLKEGELEAFINKIGISKYSKFLLETSEECIENENEIKKKKRVDQKEKNKKHEKVKEKLQDRKDEQKKFPGRKEKKKLIQDQEVSRPSELLNRKAKKQVTFEFEPKSYLLIKPGGKWYNMEYTNEHSSESQHESLISQYRNLAKQLYEHEINLYRSKKNAQRGANSTWIKTVVKTGTLADRMAAMTLMIQDAPVHTLHFVQELINQIKKKGSRQQCLMALTTLTELLISELLPHNRKLQTFSQHPFKILEELASGNKDARDKRLILWYFEHLLKHQFAEFVQALETLAHDAVQATKARALTTVHEILCNKPEQEKALLTQLVNKLGDPQYKLATKASYLLETLLHKHPNMKTVVCCEVERLLYRPNISLKAQYYAICFLNQMVLSHEECDLAGKLISIYFSFFHGYVKKAELDSKMLSALLSGVNRAYPYSKMDDEKMMEQMDTLYRIVHVVNFTTSVQALMLLFQVMDSRQTVSNRYYVALYRKLLDPGLAQCSKQAMFLNLLYKSLKSDVVLRRVKAFIKRILQAACGQTPAFICGALYLISEILKLKPGIRVLLQEHGESDEEEHFKDIDNSDEEEIFEDLDEKVKKKSDEGKKYIDVDERHAAKEQKDVQNNIVKAKAESTTSGSWLHHKNQGGKCLGNYDPFHRNPLACGADRIGLWELKLSEHFHPSVTLFATTILQGDHIQYSGDPLQDFTLMRFLDRFVYRNPKQHKGKENTDSVVMQPKQKLLLNDVRNLPVNSQKFIEREESQIPVDEIFFHRYYKRLNELEKERRFRRSDEAMEDVEDDEFERLLDFYEGEKSYNTLIDDNLDFASNMKQESKNAKKVEDTDSDLEDDVDDLNDDKVSLGSLDEDDFEEVVGEDGGMFMDDTEEIGNVLSSNKCKTHGKRKKDFDFAKSVSGKKPKKSVKESTNIFAAAEEFGYLLDENAGSKFDNIGINAMSNKDKASMKQLQWESDRDAWIRGKDARTLRKQKNFKAKKLQNKHKRFLNNKR
ncbi:CCAAT/enhancer-binding protein zeta isoform X2 [Stegostoma tigrinum]|uniref:CCAAT/enhancer-binding protein zeta isoform X2 n=1 Tax=Stegostoma tigrinum TaxID=3053191 RepID=UPI0028708837|nr:CCAAT/enhancer-binding protein zeta isoform X2 [Stegostoma tigrinum]